MSKLILLDKLGKVNRILLNALLECDVCFYLYKKGAIKAPFDLNLMMTRYYAKFSPSKTPAKRAVDK